MSIHNKIIFITIPIIVYVAFFIVFSDREKIVYNLLHVRLDYFLLFVSFWSVGVILRIFRWIFYTDTFMSKIPFKRNVLYYLSGYSMLLSPGRVGEIIRSPFIKRDYGISISKTASITFVERFYDLLATFTIISVALSFTNLPKTILLAPIIIISIMILLMWNKKWLLKISNNLQKIRFLKSIIPDMNESFDTIFPLLKPKRFIISISITLTVVLFEALGVYYLLQSQNITFNFATLTVIVHVSSFLGAISMLPAGLGVQEGSFSGLLVLYHIPKDIAFSTSLLFRLFTTGMFTIIGIISLRIISKLSLQK